MASTNKTTNYELSQFVETDRPAWLTDYNSDMRKLDTALKGVSDVASGASGSISALADRMSTAEGNISTNTNDIDALEARADALEAQAQSTAGTIANIQTEQTAQNLGIEAATELGYNLARPYDSASTYAVGDYVLFQNTLYKCVTAVPVGEAFVPTKWFAIKVMDEVGANGDPIQTFNNNNPLFTGVVAPDGSVEGTNIQIGPAFTFNPTMTKYSPANIRINSQSLKYKRYSDHIHLVGSIDIRYDSISISDSSNIYENFILTFDPTKIALPGNSGHLIPTFHLDTGMSLYALTGMLSYNAVNSTMRIRQQYVKVRSPLLESIIYIDSDIYGY